MNISLYGQMDADTVRSWTPSRTRSGPAPDVVPPLLAGRERELAAFDVTRRRCEELGEGDRPWVIHGLRGVGKTVLLGGCSRRSRPAG